MASEYKDAPLGELPAVKAVRSIFHATGVDPTRYRPSSEALLRRAVKGKGLYFINSAVDVVNYFSLKTLLPMGIFDADRIQPPIEFRAGREGETYQGVGRDVLNLTGFPLLADAEGPFGSAVSDSVRTRVTGATTRLLWATFVAHGAAPDFDEFAAAMIRFNGGVVDKNTVFHTA
jgi:DNA/RNA-binding domain of Phe-tRNA-synthetase-like protein